MNVVWRFPLKAQALQPIKVPRGSEAIHFSVDNATGELVMFMLVDDTEPIEEGTVVITATGEPIPDGVVAYLGSVTNGATEFHIFAGGIDIVAGLASPPM